ncbi:MAG: hypothetical protein ACOC4I_01520 [Spirochaetota bacterium]
MSSFFVDSRFVIGIVFLLTLGFSLTVYTVSPPGRVERVLLFPGSVESGLAGEMRLVPRNADPEGSLSAFVAELIAGPGRIDRSRVVPRGTRVRMVMVRDGRAFIDLSPALLDASGTRIVLSLPEMLETIRRNILYNFRSLDEVTVTIGGELLNEEAFR